MIKGQGNPHQAVDSDLFIDVNISKRLFQDNTMICGSDRPSETHSQATLRRPCLVKHPLLPSFPKLVCTKNCNNSPTIPRRISLIMSMVIGRNLVHVASISKRFLFLASSHSALAWLAVSVSGFSHKTCFPDISAIIKC